MESIYSKSRLNFPYKEKIKLEQENISNKNKILIKEFLDYIGSKGSSAYRQAKLSTQLRRIALILDKDLDDVNRQDIQRVVNYINLNNQFAPATQADYRRAIKQFYKWFKDEDVRTYSDDKSLRETTRLLYRLIEKDLPSSYKKDEIDPSSIITEEDIQLIVSKCRSIRDIALIKFLHETGVRVGELLNIRKKHITFNSTFAIVTVTGKTGRRNIPILTSIPSLTKWLEMHPFRDDSNSYLWLGENHRNMDAPLRYTGVVNLLSKAFKRVNLKKKCNPHWFRHSRASLLAPNLTEVMLCKYMGWVIGSEQVQTYCHLCTNQLENAYLKVNGLEDNKEKSITKIIKCNCEAINEGHAKYCYRCGKPLKLITILQESLVMKNEQ